MTDAGYEAGHRTADRAWTRSDRGRPPASTGWRAAPIPGILLRPLPRTLADPRAASPYVNAFSVDVEDWRQSVLDRSLSVSTRFIAPTYRIAEMLAETGGRATFFVLGNVARVAPGLLRDLLAAGHEVQVHGFDHQPVYEMTPDEFRQDLQRTRGVVEDVVGRRVYGYRAPRFSIDRRCPWAFNILAECGFRYDASIVPMRVRGYGVPGWPREFCRVRTRLGDELIEAPVAVGRLMGLPVPIGGGGFARLWPWPILRAQYDRFSSRRIPAVFYCHPHEFDPDGIDHADAPIPRRLRLHQSVGRRAMRRRVGSLLRRFRFGAIEDFLRPAIVAEASGPAERTRASVTLERHALQRP